MTYTGLLVLSVGSRKRPFSTAVHSEPNRVRIGCFGCAAIAAQEWKLVVAWFQKIQKNFGASPPACQARQKELRRCIVVASIFSIFMGKTMVPPVYSLAFRGVVLANGSPKLFLQERFQAEHLRERMV